MGIRNMNFNHLFKTKFVEIDNVPYYIEPISVEVKNPNTKDYESTVRYLIPLSRNAADITRAFRRKYNKRCDCILDECGCLKTVSILRIDELDENIVHIDLIESYKK